MSKNENKKPQVSKKPHVIKESTTPVTDSKNINAAFTGSQPISKGGKGSGDGGDKKK